MKQQLKTRLRYGLIILLVVGLGLASRKFSAALPFFVANHAGDTLWAGMIYFGIRFLLPHKSLKFAAAFSLLFCLFIEISQLYQADWINAIRQTTLGALVLGKGFLWIDLLRYLSGIVVSFALDKYYLSSSKSAPGADPREVSGIRPRV